MWKLVRGPFAARFESPFGDDESVTNAASQFFGVVPFEVTEDVEEPSYLGRTCRQSLKYFHKYILVVNYFSLFGKTESSGEQNDGSASVPSRDFAVVEHRDESPKFWITGYEKKEKLSMRAPANEQSSFGLAHVHDLHAYIAQLHEMHDWF